MAGAERTLEAMFEFVGKLGVSHYCFHDRDLVQTGDIVYSLIRAHGLHHTGIGQEDLPYAVEGNQCFGTTNEVCVGF